MIQLMILAAFIAVFLLLIPAVLGLLIVMWPFLLALPVMFTTYLGIVLFAEAVVGLGRKIIAIIRR